MKIDLLKIKPTFPPPKKNKLGFDSYIASIERLVKEVVPESIFQVHEASHFIPIQSSFLKLHQALPLIKISEADSAPCTLSISLLCLGDHTHGVGRFMCDQIAGSLIPGKHLPITVMRSLAFKFLVDPDSDYFITELYLEVENDRDLKIIHENFPKLKEEILMTVLGVEHARKVVLTRGMSLEEKGMILFENLSSLVKRPHQALHYSIFDETQHILLKALKEKSPDRIPDHLLPILEAKPQIFDSTIFKEIQNYLMIFDETFSKTRPLSLLKKLLSYLYLFRKIITHTILTKPLERHTSFKLLRSELKCGDESIPIIAFLIGINLIDDHELMEEREVFKVVEEELPDIELVKESLIAQKEEKERVRILYFEIKHSDNRPFVSEEIKRLKKKIPKKIRGCIQKSPPPTPSNFTDEETMRNILTLTKELQIDNDPPKVIIQFHNQSEKKLHFSVILARIQKPNSPHLTLPNTAQIIVGKMKRKVCGILNKRYLKEAYIFDVHIKGEKSIAEGRQELLVYLKKNLHELHDFNGGVITKQYETLAAFKNLLSDPFHDPLIENYFYSITPSYMQSLIPPEVLKEHFNLLLRTLDKDFLSEENFVTTQAYGDYALFMVYSTESYLIDQAKERAHAFIPDQDTLISTYIKVFDLHALGLLIADISLMQSLKNHLQPSLIDALPRV